jgi:hypothetical protein
MPQVYPLRLRRFSLSAYHPIIYNISNVPGAGSCTIRRADLVLVTIQLCTINDWQVRSLKLNGSACRVEIFKHAIEASMASPSTRYGGERRDGGSIQDEKGNNGE